MRIRFPAAVLAAALVLVISAPEVEGADTGKYDFRFHGFFKTDVSYNSAQIHPGNYHLYVPAYGEADNSMYFTARESRLGFDFFWNEDKVRTRATFEFDFFGGGDAPENKAGPMLRHAYLKMSGKSWSLLAGQTWDVISPLVPKTVNYSVAWGEGNIGYRRPQVRFSTWTGISEKGKLTLDLAITRNMGGDNSISYNDTITVTSGDGVDNGADAAVPAVQGRIGISSEFSEEGMLAVGISGHYGQEKFDRTDLTASKVTEESIDSWSVNGDVALKLNRYLSLKGEFFMGEALQTFLGGALQNTDGIYEPLPTVGGWGMVSLSPTGRLSVNAGYSFDDPDAAEFDIPKGGSERFRDMNSTVFGNAIYAITDNVSGMLEFSYIKTEYLTKTYIGNKIESTAGEYDCYRVQFALKAAIE
jgi:hypothetical protein